MLNIDYEYKDLAYGFDSVAAMHIYLSTALMRKAKGIDAEALGNSKRIEYLAQAYEKMAQVERIKQKIAFAMKGNLISEGKSCLEQYAKMEIELNDILTKNGLEVPWAGNEQ